MRITRRVARSLFILLIAVAMPGIVFADDATPSVKLLVGRSAIVDIGTPISRVSLTSADVADAMVTASNQLLVNGKMPGTISMFVWERNGALHQYEIVVQRDLARLNEQIKRLFPTEAIDAQSNGRSIVLSGFVSSKEEAAKATSVATGYVDKPEDVVNLLKLQEGLTSNQVLLKVRFAEVSRSALTELGLGIFTSALGINNTLGRVTAGTPTPGFDELKWTKESSSWGSDVTSSSGKNTFSDFLNLFLFSEKYDIGVVIKALQTKGLFQSLAEPNLVSESGKEASFLAGGEIPVPIAQGTGGNVAISVMYKEFGIRLTFTPVVSGNRIHLKVKPEVSTLDFANAVTLQGFRIPALTTRRTETELELNDNQTFAVAGLMNNNVTSTLQKIPGIGDIPILGALFKSKAAQKNQTELVVMITPQIVTRASSGVTNALPRTPEPYLPVLPEKATVNPPAPAFSPERPAYSNPSPSPAAANPNKSSANPAPATKKGASAAKPSAAEAAAAMSALTPASHAPAVVASPAGAASAPAPAAATAAPAAAAPRPLTSDERKALERAQKADGVAKARQEEIMKRASKGDQERQAKLAKEKEKQDREQAKIAAVAAKRQAEIDKNHQKALDEAAQKAKEAQARYDALAAKSQKQ